MQPLGLGPQSRESSLPLSERARGELAAVGPASPLLPGAGCPQPQCPKDMERSATLGPRHLGLLYGELGFLE